MRQAHELSEAEFWEEVRRQLAERPDAMPTDDMAEEAEQRSPELAAAEGVIRGIVNRLPERFADAPPSVRQAVADAQAEYRSLLRQLAARPLAAGYAWQENRPGRTAAGVLATSDQAASDLVGDLLRAADRPAQQRTYWPSASVWRTDSYGETMPGTAWTVLIAIDPVPPPCTDGRSGHAWPERRIDGAHVEGVRVHDNSGGLIIIRTCPHCGCLQTTDTWAMDPETKEEGLTSVFYTPPGERQ